MEELGKTVVQQIDQEPHAKASEYRDFYANSCSIRIAPYDLSILFGQIKQIDGAMVNEDQALVTLAPAQFKALSILCSNMIQAFEEAFGEVKLPPTFVPRTDIGSTIKASLKKVVVSGGKPQLSRRSRAASRD